MSASRRGRREALRRVAACYFHFFINFHGGALSRMRALSWRRTVVMGKNQGF
jgi:hypothetical protein